MCLLRVGGRAGAWEGAGGTKLRRKDPGGRVLRFRKDLGDQASLWFADGLMGCGYSGPDRPWCPQAVCPVGCGPP